MRFHHSCAVSVPGTSLSTPARNRAGWLKTNLKPLAIGALASGVFVAALVVHPGPLIAEGAPRIEWHEIAETLLVLFAGVLLGSFASRSAPHLASTREQLTATLTLGLAWVLTGCLIVDPARFNRWVAEDGLLEWASALLPLVGGVWLLSRVWRARSVRGSRQLGFLTLLGVSLVLVGMEEASWFQRQLQFATPSWLAVVNVQQEFNLHNTATDLSENIYYSAALLLLVGSRVLFRSGRGVFAWMLPLLPGALPFVIGAVGTSFNWEMWRVPFIALGTAVGVATSVVAARYAWNDGERRAAFLASITGITIVGTQAVFLTIGDHMVRRWDSTEAKEFFLAAGLFVYAMEQAAVLSRAKAET